MMQRVFLLSPAVLSGRRGQLLLEGGASPLAASLRNGGAPVGEVYQFISSLYFRGKMAYSAAFANPPAGVEGRYVITAGFGLMPAECRVGLECLREMASIEVDSAEPRFRTPLDRDARALAVAAGSECEIVLLGSVASGKYTDVLTGVFGPRLRFPSEFVGRGDMSRGGLMLRCAREGRELDYTAVIGAVLRGKRPPRLEPVSRGAGRNRFRGDSARPPVGNAGG